eukprot:528713_1
MMNTLALLNGLDVQALVELIRIAETSERYEDMCKFVKRLIELKSEKGHDLNNDEKNLFSVAYKNVVGAKRASWRTLAGGFDGDVDTTTIRTYKSLVENELETICLEVLSLLNDHLCKNVHVDATDHETEVFYLKMKGDYNRYLSEFRPSIKELKSEEFYQKAMDVAKTHLSATHPTRLGIALNFSVYYYEILKQPERACDLAKK